jgi:uncharacterized protein (PEP-CTERM system associated)
VRLAQAPPYWATALPAPPPPPRRRVRRAALLVAATYGLAAIAHAQSDSGAASTGGGAGGGDTTATGTTATGTTATGTATGAATGTAAAASDAAPGSLRAAIEGVLPGVNAPPAAHTTDPAWQITSGISLLEQWTDNALQTASDRKGSFITVVSPSLSINGSTSRLTADLYYAPTASYYTSESSQNQIGQNLGANALLTLAPEELFIRASGYAAVQSINGANGPNDNQSQNRQNQVQTYNFSIEPYATHRFGGWGTAEIGATASETSASQLGGGTNVQSLTSKQEFASFTSGENFGRLSSTLLISATQDTGTGALQGATQNVATYQGGYAITHSIIALGSIGWEDIRYSGIGAPHYNDGTWSVGLELLPNPDSSIIVTYGHQAGATSANVNASYAPTASIRLSAQYTAGITTAAEALNNALSGASFDALGRPVNTTTGAAINTGNNFFGYNASVYQSRNLSISAAWLRPRDAFQITLQQQTQTPVGTGGTTVLATQGNLALGEGLAASSGTTGTLSWQHDLSPVVNTNLSFQYGVLHNSTPLLLTNGVLTATLGKQIQESKLLTVNAQVNWQITRTLTGLVQYSYTTNDYSNGLPGVSSNLIAVGLHKTF